MTQQNLKNVINLLEKFGYSVSRNDADLSNADLSNADLSNADLSNAGKSTRYLCRADYCYLSIC